MTDLTPPRAKTEEVGSWCIWTKGGRRPSFFHPTEAQAMAEAERLAHREPGRKYIVMQMVAKVSIPPIEMGSTPPLSTQGAE